MRPIDADAFDKCLEDAEDKAIHMQKYVFASALNTIRGNLRTFPAIEPEREKMADLIDRQAAIDALEKVAELFPWRIPGNRDSYDRYNEAWNDAIGRAEIEIEKLPSAEPEPDHFREASKMIWHECDPDDPSSFPDDDRNVLVSFSNFSVPLLGQWRVDPDGSGNWYDGDSDDTFLSADLYVD